MTSNPASAPDLELVFDGQGNPIRKQDGRKSRPSRHARRSVKPAKPGIVVPPHRIFALNRQGAAAPLSFDQLMAEMARADVVICGEYHDDPATHKMELALFSAFAKDKKYERVYLTMEMFEQDVQQTLANYVLGGLFGPEDTPTEKVFLAKTRPWSNYHTDYRPLIEYARSYALPVIAANAPTAIARRVGREGWAAVEPTLGNDRKWVAHKTSAPEDGYWQQFKSFMGGMGESAHGGGMSEKQIRHFYEAQCLKDDTMAEAIVLRASDGHLSHVGNIPGGSVFHVNGSFHSDHGYGTAQRVRERLSKQPAKVVYTIAIRPIPDFNPVSAGGSLDPQGETLADGTPVADFVIFVPAPKK